jgi:ATP-binding cassette subfamily B protein
MFCILTRLDVNSVTTPASLSHTASAFESLKRHEMDISETIEFMNSATQDPSQIQPQERAAALDPKQRPKAQSAGALLGLAPFVKPYRIQLSFAGIFLLLAAASTLCFPWALRMLIDRGLNAHTSATELAWQFVQLFWVASALAIFSGARFYMVSWLGERITTDLRQAVYTHVIQQSPAFFETTQTGEVLSRLSADTTLVQTVVGSSLSMGLRNLVMGVGALAMLVWTNPWLMLQVIAVLCLIVLPSLTLGRRVRRLSRASQDRVADTSAVAQEVLNSVAVVQSYTAEHREAQRYATASHHAFQTAVKRTKARSFLVSFIILATSAALLWGLYKGSLAVMQGSLSPGVLGQTLIYVLLLASAFAVLGEVYGDLLRAAGATERLIELLNAQSPVEESPSPKTFNIRAQGSQVAFRNVTFHYPSRADKAALSDLSFELRAGQNAALVGPSGAGKTSVFSLLLRFYDPQSGSIEINGVDIRDLSIQALRSHIGLVPQEPVIFSTTAYENILYGNPQASKAQVLAAAKAAFADEFIEQWPQGYDTFLGERGVRISGGQKQRISIARAMLKNPPLLLLDEATSALDAHSERQVQAALQSAMKDRTTLVIAHRLSTVRQADPILVLEQGSLVEQGRHHELFDRNGLYASLAKLQFTQSAQDAQV